MEAARRNLISVILAAGLLVLIAGVLGYFAFRSKPISEEQKKTGPNFEISAELAKKIKPQDTPTFEVSGGLSEKIKSQGEPNFEISEDLANKIKPQ